MSSTTITDEVTGLTLTRYLGPANDGGMRTRYRLAKPDGGEFDLNAPEWLAVIGLTDRWKEEE